MQTVGFIGALREHILMTTIYWAFCIMACGIYAVVMLIPHLVEGVYVESHVQNFIKLLICVTETTVVGWFLHDLYQMRKARKEARFQMAQIARTEVAEVA